MDRGNGEVGLTQAFAEVVTREKYFVIFCTASIGHHISKFDAGRTACHRTTLVFAAC
jgi:hypothetical protein